MTAASTSAQPFDGMRILSIDRNRASWEMLSKALFQSSAMIRVGVRVLSPFGIALLMVVKVSEVVLVLLKPY